MLRPCEYWLAKHMQCSTVTAQAGSWLILPGCTSRGMTQTMTSAQAESVISPWSPRKKAILVGPQVDLCPLADLITCAERLGHSMSV